MGYKMNQLQYALLEIKANGQLSEQALHIVEEALAAHEVRMSKHFPNYNLFTTGTGQSYGLMMQRRIISSFCDLATHTGSSEYDAEWGQQRVEIKSIKCTQGRSTDYIGSRIVNMDAEIRDKSFGTGSFQQVKPKACDWFLFHILYGNAERLFVVPSCMFSQTPGRDNKEPGKLLLSIQHRDHQTEGQANMGTILDVSDIFEVAKGYSSAKANCYCFATCAAEVVHRLNAINWVIPDDVARPKE